MAKSDEQDILREIHTPNELSQMLGDSIIEAKLLQRNYDSVVLSLTTNNKGKWVYKFYKKNSIEPIFYRQAISEVLIDCYVLLNNNKKIALLLRFIEGKNLNIFDIKSDNLIEYAKDILSKISTIKNPPIFECFENPEKWYYFCLKNFDNIKKTISLGLFTHLKLDYIDILMDKVFNIKWDNVFDGNCGLIHCDLHNDNIFLMPDGNWKIIDWEKPSFGPTVVDMASLLESFELDPYKYVPSEAVKMMNIVKLFYLLDDFQNKHEKIRQEDERLAFLRLSEVIGRN